MNRFSLKSFAVVAITALLLAILAVPVMAAGEGAAAKSSGGSSISSEQSAPFAAYTKRRKHRVIRRRVRRHRHRVIRRRRRVVRRTVTPTVSVPTAPLATSTTPTEPSTPAVDEAALAQTILDGLKARYPRYLGNATVEFGNANGYQAISYYTIGRIVISPTHTATLQRILDHEVWHIIDWQDNSQMNWGEAIPPANMGEYAN